MELSKEIKDRLISANRAARLVARNIWDYSGMTFDQMSDWLEFDEDDDSRTLWECLVEKITTEIFASEEMKEIDWMNGPPENQNKPKG